MNEKFLKIIFMIVLKLASRPNTAQTNYKPQKTFQTSPYLFILNTHCGVTFSLSQSFEWTGSQSAFDVAAKNTSSSAILDTETACCLSILLRMRITHQWRHLSERHASRCGDACRISLFFRPIKQRQVKHKAGVAVINERRSGTNSIRLLKCDVIKNWICEMMGFVRIFWKKHN